MKKFSFSIYIFADGPRKIINLCVETWCVRFVGCKCRRGGCGRASRVLTLVRVFFAGCKLNFPGGELSRCADKEQYQITELKNIRANLSQGPTLRSLNCTREFNTWLRLVESYL